jgi:hypothetical protein
MVAGRQDNECAEWEQSARTRKRRDLVFTWEDGGAYHPEYLSQVFMHLMKKLNLVRRLGGQPRLAVRPRHRQDRICRACGSK